MATATSGVGTSGESSAVGASAAEIKAGEVSVTDARDWLSAGRAVLLDVREPDEHAREKIDGAILMPLSRFDPAQAAALAKAGQSIVVHCRSGRRSADAVRRLAPIAGPGARVLSMAGGIEAWKQAGLPSRTDTRVSAMSVMRQVQLVIGVGVLAGSALAWLVHPGFLVIPAFLGAGLTFAGATGTCALATLLGAMPWNKAASAAGGCATGTCG